jgi:uncharacterized phage protein gp47/JayE
VTLDTQNGKYDERTVQVVRDRIETELQERLDDPESIESAVVQSYIDSLAETVVTQQEAGLAAVHDAAFLDSAQGADLDAVVEPIQAERRENISATGVQQFLGDGRVDADYTIPSGTTVQTQNGTVSFDTTETRTLSFYDGFERTSPTDEYSGSTAGWSRSTSFSTEGNGSLRGADGSAGVILKDGSTFVRGGDLHADVQFDASGGAPRAVKLLYLADSTGDWYAVEADATNGTLDIWSPAQSEASTSLSIPTDTELHLWVETTTQGKHVGHIADSNGEIGSVTWTESNPDRYVGQVGLDHSNGGVNVDAINQSRVATKIRAITGGTETNLGSGSLVVMSNPPAGVNTTTNPVSTGNADYVDTSGRPLIPGRDEEDDESFRSRVRDGAPEKQHPIVDNLTDLPSVTSVELVTNTNDSTDGDGRPGKSVEAIVPSTADYVNVAEAIFDAKAYTTETVGGYDGTSKSRTVEDDTGTYSESITFSTATETDVDMSLSIVVDDTYDGDDALRERVVEYIGGARPDGSTAVGTGIGDDVYIDQIKDVVTEDDGVVGFDDGNTSFTPSTTTDSNGLSIIDIADTNIAVVDGVDNSISISTTTV